MSNKYSMGTIVFELFILESKIASREGGGETTLVPGKVVAAGGMLLRTSQVKESGPVDLRLKYHSVVTEITRKSYDEKLIGFFENKFPEKNLRMMEQFLIFDIFIQNNAFDD